jgi:hypothetical protein
VGAGQATGLVNGITLRILLFTRSTLWITFTTIKAVATSEDYMVLAAAKPGRMSITDLILPKALAWSVRRRFLATKGLLAPSD